MIRCLLDLLVLLLERLHAFGDLLQRLVDLSCDVYSISTCSYLFSFHTLTLQLPRRHVETRVPWAIRLSEGQEEQR